MGVVAKELEACWCFLIIRGEFLGDPRVCLEPGRGGGGGGGGGLDEPSLVATVCLLPLLRRGKRVPSLEFYRIVYYDEDSLEDRDIYFVLYYLTRFSERFCR